MIPGYRTARQMVAGGAPRLGIWLAAASLSINVLGLLLPLVMLQVFDRIIPNGAYETLGTLALALGVTLLLDLALKICRIVVLAHEGEAYEHLLAHRVANWMLHADGASFERLRTGEHHERIGAISALREHHAGAARLMLIDLPFSMIFVAAIWMIGGDLVIVPIAGLVLLAGFSVATKVMHKPVLAQRRQLDEQRYSFLSEFLTQIVTLKSARMEPQILRRYELLQDKSVEINRRLSLVGQFGTSFSSVFSTGSVTAMALAGAYLVSNGGLAIAELAACMLLNGRTIQPMLRLLGYWPQLEAAGASRKKLVDLFTVPTRQERNPRHGEIRGEIDFRGVTTLLADGAEHFDPLWVTVAPGETLVIVGDDGVGKFELVRAVLGEIEPARGRILVDGRTASSMREVRGRGGFAVLEREPVVFDGTILDNVTLFGDEDATARALAIAEEIGLAQEIERLPDGWDTVISSGGVGTASRGLAQLVAIARALALEPRLLVFHEANTALDHTLDAKAREALERRKGRMTIVLISRRPSWQALADKRVELTVADVRAWDDDLINDRSEADVLLLEQRDAA